MADASPRTVLHVDMDAFFASVEQLDNPELRGKPVVVGGGERGVVAAASYEVRKYGVRSAMPATKAKRLCPHAIFVRPRMQRYAEVSGQVMEVFRDLVPVVEQTSVDEAYLDATGMERVAGDAVSLARRLKHNVREAVGLNCSVGVAPNKFLAKIASDKDKPDGLFVLRPEGVPAFLQELPVGDIPGVGPRARQALAQLGVKYAADLAKRSDEFWKERFGAFGAVLAARGRGQDDRPVEPWHEIKSISGETTFTMDIFDLDELEAKLWGQAERVGTRLRRKGFYGRTVTLKVKYADFTSISRNKSLAMATQSTREIFNVAAGLLRTERLKMPVRLIGVGVANLERGPQLHLLPEAGHDRLESAVDAIRERFGSAALVTGRTFESRRP